MLYPEEQININLPDHWRDEEMESVWTGGEKGERYVHCVRKEVGMKRGREEKVEKPCWAILTSENQYSRNLSQSSPKSERYQLF